MIGFARAAAAVVLCLAVAGCASQRGPANAGSADTGLVAIDDNAGPSWRGEATSRDRARIANWRADLVAGLAAARRAGHGAEIDVGGALFEVDLALPEARMPAGAYDCSVTKLGGSVRQDGARGGLDYVAYPDFRCLVSDDGSVRRFVKLTGSQRPVGRLYPDTDRREIFLGTLELGDETGTMKYGADPMRDMAGIVQRIEDRRWRMLLPSSTYELRIDVIELTPAARQ